MLFPGKQVLFMHHGEPVKTILDKFITQPRRAFLRVVPKRAKILSIEFVHSRVHFVNQLPTSRGQNSLHYGPLGFYKQPVQ